VRMGKQFSVGARLFLTVLLLSELWRHNNPKSPSNLGEVCV
jgi:hypothetical protein